MLNKNTDALSWTIINHLKECVNFHSKISTLASNQDEFNNETHNINDLNNDEKVTEKYYKFVDLYHSKSVSEYSKIELLKYNYLTNHT